VPRKKSDLHKSRLKTRTHKVTSCIIIIRVKFALAIGCILVCFACNKNSPHLHEAAPPVLEASWISLQSPDSSVSLGVPSSFHSALDPNPVPQMDFGTDTQKAPPPPEEDAGGQAQAQPTSPTDAAADQAVNRFVGDINGMSSQLEEAQHQKIVSDMKQRGYVIWAWLNGKGTIGERTTQISVKKIPDSGESNLDSAVNAAKAGMPGPVTVTNITLPIGEARKAEADAQDRIGDEQTEIKYVLLDGGDEYIVDFEATNAKEQIDLIADPVMQTFRVKPKA